MIRTQVRLSHPTFLVTAEGHLTDPLLAIADVPCQLHTFQPHFQGALTASQPRPSHGAVLPYKLCNSLTLKSKASAPYMLESVDVKHDYDDWLDMEPAEVLVNMQNTCYSIESL